MRKSWAAVPVAALLLPIWVAPVSARPLASPVPARVLVMLREQADLSAVTGDSQATRLRRTVETLQTQTRRSQGPVLARLRALAARGLVTGTTPLWITNAVSVTATADVIAELEARSDVARVVPDVVDIVPAAGAPEPNLTRIHAPELWGLGETGEGVVVANLDSGVDVSHPDLVGRWRGGTNSWFDPYGQHPGTPVDLTGHGTATMGVMVGGDAGGTSIGTAPGATWIAAKIFNDAGGATASAVHQAFQWVLDPDRDPSTADAPQVVNGSWSIGAGPGCDLSFQPDVQALRTAGILPVFAAGNYGPGGATSVSPANYPESVSVGAVSGTDLVQSSSSRGPSSCGGRSRAFPDLVAPGADVYTADRYGLYQYASGTSVAAPHVAGALALLLGARPDLGVDMDLQAVEATARDLGDAGRDEVYGNGLVDVSAAYGSLPPPALPQPDFAVSLSPDAVTVRAGDSAALTVRVTATAGFADEVALSLSGLDPAQSSATFAPMVLPGGGTSTLTVGTTSAMAAGAYPFTVTATAGALSRSAAGVLTVPAPPPTLYYSTSGNANPPGVSGQADDADVYGWDASSFSREFDASLAGVPGGANVDGYDRVSATRFYVSFVDNVTIARPGPDLSVQDEDVVLYDAGTWSVFFDGTGHGLTAGNLDLDAISVAGSTVYFSTVGNTNPPGVGGTADDADVYSWNGTSYARVWDASANGVPGAANVDGFARVDATHFYLSFAADTTLPVLGAVQDEDVVFDNDGAWSVYFDGTAHGLTSNNLDVDAFDLG